MYGAERKRSWVLSIAIRVYLITLRFSMSPYETETPYAADVFVARPGKRRGLDLKAGFSGFFFTAKKVTDINGAGKKKNGMQISTPWLA